MKKLFGLVNFVAFAVLVYEIYFLITNGTAGNVNNIVIVMVLGTIFAIKFFIKSAVKIVKWLFIAAIIYAVATHLLPIIA